MDVNFRLFVVVDFCALIMSCFVNFWGKDCQHDGYPFVINDGYA